MARPFDATTRQLIEMGPADGLRYLGIPVADPSRVRVIDSNLSTIVPEADRVIRVDDPEPWIEHLELQAGRDLQFAGRPHLYSVVLGGHYEIPVRTTLVLLRPEADGPELNGILEKRDRDGAVYDVFRYHVVRIWEQPVERFLNAGLTVLPLAPVANIEPDRLTEVLAVIARRLKEEAPAEQEATLWAATEILMSLRYPKDKIETSMREVSTMSLGIRGIEESWLVQEWLQKGRAEGEAKARLEQVREDVLRAGRRKLGIPTEAVVAEIQSINDRVRLDVLFDRVFDVSSWDELLAPPKA